jgi:hypothetical protein
MRNLLIASFAFLVTNYTVGMLRRPVPIKQSSTRSLVRLSVPTTPRASYSTRPSHSLPHNESVKNLYSAIKFSAKSNTGRAIFINNLQQAVANESAKNARNLSIFIGDEARAKQHNDREKLLSLSAALTDATLKYFEDLQQGDK